MKPSFFPLSSYTYTMQKHGINMQANSYCKESNAEYLNGEESLKYLNEQGWLLSSPSLTNKSFFIFNVFQVYV